MGLGLYIGSPMEPSGILKEKLSAQKILETVKKESRQYLESKGLLYPQAIIHRDVLYLKLHPAEEDVQFFVDDRDYLICSARTSSAGPGYHAFLVELLEMIQGPAKINWIWDDEEKEFMDDTTYFSKRDFNTLQMEMVVILYTLFFSEETTLLSGKSPNDYGGFRGIVPIREQT